MTPIIHKALAALLSSLCMAACGGTDRAGAQTQTSAPPAAQVEAGSLRHTELSSTALRRTMTSAVYLPPGYSPAVRYPVLYLFYGYGGNRDAYFDGFLAINRTADRLIAARAIAPLIIVVPAYDNGFGVNTTLAQSADSAGGSIGLYEDYLMDELLPHIERSFSTDARRERRYVGGISMGGFAALHLALRHPAMFSKVGAHSAALWDYSASDQFIGQRDWLYATPALRARRDPLLLAATADLQGLRFYLDAGSSDRLRAQDQAMHKVLQDRGAAAEFHTSSGGHDAGYWSGQLENYLRFYSAN